MKKLENKKIDIGDGLKSYVDLVRVVANFVPPREGVTPEQMKLRFRLLDAIKGADKEIVFEDADATLLNQLTQNLPWAIVHRDIVEFSDAVSKL